MTKYISLFSVAILFLALVFSSCQNQVDGCTDPAALNYDPDATNDDGSCQYAAPVNNTAGIIFWMTQSSANSYLGDGVTALKFIIDGTLVGTHSMGNFDATAPICDVPNRITTKRTVPNGQIQFVPYVITDQGTDTLITGSFQFLGGSCYAVEINY